MRWTLRNTWHWVRRRRKYEGVKIVSSRAEIPELTGDYLYVVGEAPSFKWVVLDCPCRSGHRIDVNLMSRSYPNWDLSIRGGQATLYPSLDVSDCPIQSHFWLDRNKIHWV